MLKGNFIAMKHAAALRCLFLILVCALFGSVHADPKNLSDMVLGHAITLKARVGERVLRREAPGVYVVTLRDDYGNGSLGYLDKDPKDIKYGVTYFLTGTPITDPKTGKLDLHISTFTPAYPPEPVPPPDYTGPIVLIVLVGAAAAAGLFVLNRRLKRMKAAQAALAETPYQLPEPWEYAEVIYGPDSGARFALRGDKIPVGRNKDPLTSIALTEDPSVSRDHGVLTRVGEDIYYEDTNSRCGSWIDEVPVTPGSPVKIENKHFLLRLGPTTTVRVGSPRNRFTATSFYSEGGDGDDARGPSSDAYGRATTE